MPGTYSKVAVTQSLPMAAARFQLPSAVGPSRIGTKVVNNPLKGVPGSALAIIARSGLEGLTATELRVTDAHAGTGAQAGSIVIHLRNTSLLSSHRGTLHLVVARVAPPGTSLVNPQNWKVSPAPRGGIGVVHHGRAGPGTLPTKRTGTLFKSTGLSFLRFNAVALQRSAPADTSPNDSYDYARGTLLAGRLAGTVPQTSWIVGAPVSDSSTSPGTYKTLQKSIRWDQPNLIGLGTLRVGRGSTRTVAYNHPYRRRCAWVGVAEFSPRLDEGSVNTFNLLQSYGSSRNGSFVVTLQNSTSLLMGSAIVGSVCALIVPVGTMGP